VSLDFIEMRKKIQEALGAGRFFITISYVEEVTREGLSEDEIQHYYLTHNFPRDDLMQSLEHLSKQILPESLEVDEESNP